MDTTYPSPSPSDVPGDVPTTAVPLDVVADGTIRGRIAAALLRLVAAVAAFRDVAADDLATLSQSDRYNWDNAVAALNNWTAQVQTWNDEGTDDAYRADVADDYANRAETSTLHHGAILAATIDMARRSLPIGTEPTPDDVDDAIRRGGNFVTFGRYDLSRARQSYPETTAWDVLSWARRVVDDIGNDVRATSRTLRAADRAHGYGKFAPIMSEMVADGDLSHPAWRTTSEPMTSVPLVADGRAVEGNRATTWALPTSPREMGHGATIRDLIAAVDSAIAQHVAEMDALSERLLAEAFASGWCGEYERTVDRLNDALRAASSETFKPRHRDYRATGYVMATVTISVPVPISASFEGAEGDDLSDAAWDALSNADVDVDDWTIADALGVPVSQVRGWDTDYDVDTSTIDDVDWEAE